MSDHRHEPFDNILVEGTVPELEAASAATAVVTPGMLVYKSGTVPDPVVTECSAAYGDGQITESTVYVVMIPASHINFTKAYAKDEVFIANESVFSIHRLSIGDRFWGRIVAVDYDEHDIFVHEAAGILVPGVAATTPTKWNCHCYRPVHYGTAGSTDTWAIFEYVGRLSYDHA